MSDPTPPGSTKNGRVFMGVGLLLALALSTAYVIAARRRFT